MPERTIADTGYLIKANYEHPFYKRWSNMIHRCYNSNFTQYKDYGGRGISVCDDWHCFDTYIEDCKSLPGYNDPSKPTVDRIDNNGNYTPENCRWASRKTQNDNRRKLRSQRPFKAIDPQGTKYTATNQTKFAEEHGLNPSNMNKVLRNKHKTHFGWTFSYL